ncbi:MAG: hypothetical protein AAFR98_04820 [Pseudomonadota bacterium]
MNSRLGRIVFALAALLSFAAGPAIGSENTPDYGLMMASFETEGGFPPGFDDFMSSDQPATADDPGSLLSGEAKQAFQDAKVAQFEYFEGSFEHRAQVFRWQLISTVIIFAVVIGIVLSGLYFSWMQFKARGPDGAEASVELGTSGVKVTSSVLGVLILVISLGFFYLYLVHVYPIFEVTQSG